MATSSQSCGVCDQRHLNKPSIVWCTECDEGLCADCQEHHSLSKASRSHSVISTVEYQKIPTDVSKITQYCSKHNEKFQIFCQKHECPCCSKCIVESHNVCQDIVNLDDVIQNAKTSNAISEIEETLVEVTENLQRIRQHQLRNLSTLKEKRKEIEKEIKTTRTKINNHLDKLQENLMKQLYGLEEKENYKINQVLSSLEKKEKEIAESQKSILNIKQHATDLQMFLSIKQIEEEVYSKENNLKSLVEGVGQHSISYRINTSIQNIMSDIKSFGEVRIESKSCDIVMIKKKTKQAQMMVPIIQSRSIENIKLTIHKTINTQGTSISGCCLLPDGRMVFTNYFSRAVQVFSNEGSKDLEVNLPCYAFGVVYISQDNTLAVSSGGSQRHCITIFDLETKQIKKFISLNSCIHGISLKNNQLVYSARDNGIRIINLHDESINTIVREEMPDCLYTATFKDKIYYTNHKTDTVTCCNLQGKPQWTFHNESVLKSPRGIDVDNDGNMFVVGRDSKNVVVISPDGQRHRVVLSASDGLDIPISVYYSRLKNQLVVANYNKTVFLFNCI